MEIVYRGIDEIRPYENNPRKNDCAVDAVAASIQEFGWKVPVVIDKNGVIVAGHTRFKAAQKLGIERIPCVIIDDLTEEQIKAYRLVDNKVSEFSRWDYDLLKKEIETITLDLEQFDVQMTEEPDFEDLFVDADQKEPKKKEYICPCCGERFEL